MAGGFEDHRAHDNKNVGHDTKVWCSSQRSLAQFLCMDGSGRAFGTWIHGIDSFAEYCLEHYPRCAFARIEQGCDHPELKIVGEICDLVLS